MRDCIVRSAFHQSILKSAHSCEDTFVIDELGLRNGESRADIAVLNGKLIGYEIKTEKDNLNRLKSQIQAYNEVFDKIYIITGLKHLDKVIEAVPEWWGIYLIETKLTDDCCFKSFRKAKVNKEKKSFGIAQLLWKKEAVEILSSTFNENIKARVTKHDLYDILASNFAPNDLGKIALKYLKSREAWRTSPSPLL